VKPSVLTRLVELGAGPDDSAEERLRKKILVASTVVIVALALIWVSIYAALGLWRSAAIPATYQLFALGSLAWFARSKRFATFRTLQLGMWLILPFALQWSLGGFSASGLVMAWAVASPFGAIILQDARASVPWFAAFLALAVVSGIAEPWLAPHAAQLPAPLLLLFTVLNITCVAAVTYGLLQYAFRQRELMQAELEKKHLQLQAEQEKSERLLLNILPAPIAARLKHSDAAIADGFSDVTVLFADIVGFTGFSAQIPPAQLVVFLNEIFSLLDGLAERHGIEKIKTIGDAYMAAAGLPSPRPDHAEAIAEMALEMRDGIAALAGPDGVPLQMRIGINTGPVVAGVIGRRKFIYDLWGDAVNLASRMESHGVAGRIHVSEQTYQRLKDRYLFEPRGTVNIKGKGELHTWLLTGRR
jgi:guanylate cyclase